MAPGEQGALVDKLQSEVCGISDVGGALDIEQSLTDTGDFDDNDV